MNEKVSKALKNPYYACELVLNRFAKYIGDETFVKWKYYLVFRKKLDLMNPLTYNEKLQWLKLHDKHEEYTQMVDKYEAKKYVASIIGEEYIIPTLGVYNSFDEIDFDKLPNQFVLKCTHNSGGIVICKDKNTLDIQKARKKMTKWMKKNPFWANREWPYKNVRPRIIAEQYLEDESGYELKDYKFFCFDGKPEYVELDFGRFSDHKRNIYSVNWEPMDFSILYPSDYEIRFERPKRFHTMVEIAKALSKGIPHVRIDLYNAKDDVFFGEITFYHGSGLETFTPKEWDYAFGELIHLPAINK